MQSCACVDLAGPRSTSSSGRKTTPLSPCTHSKRTGDPAMQFMMIVKGDENFKASGPPPQALMDAIGKLGEEAAKAGKMVSMGGLQHTAKGASVRIKSG